MAFLEIAGLDDDQGVLRRLVRERLHRPVDRLAAEPHRDDAPPAKKTDGQRFVGKARWVRSDIVAVELDELERVVGIVERGVEHSLAALRHQTGIGAMDEHDAVFHEVTPQETVEIADLHVSRSVLKVSPLSRGAPSSI